MGSLVGPFLGSARVQEPPTTPARPKSAEGSPKPLKQPKSCGAGAERSAKAISKCGKRSGAGSQSVAFLKKYPQSSQRNADLLRADRSDLQLRNFRKPPNTPNAWSRYRPTILHQRPRDPVAGVRHAPGWRRAISYCSRVIDSIGKLDAGDKSPKVSAEEWNNERKRDRGALLLVGGRLYQKLSDLPNAQANFEESYRLNPSSQAAEGLAEVAELRKDLPTAIQQYARASRSPRSDRRNRARTERNWAPHGWLMDRKTVWAITRCAADEQPPPGPATAKLMRAARRL